jgi:hypothetical protein
MQHASSGIPPSRCKGQFDEGPATEAASYICLLLRSRNQVDISKDIEHGEEFLILDSIGAPDSAKYRRIGIGRIDGESPIFDTEKKTDIILL